MPRNHTKHCKKHWSSESDSSSSDTSSSDTCIQGPVGPKGSTGPIGPQGPQGPQGPPGLCSGDCTSGNCPVLPDYHLEQAPKVGYPCGELNPDYLKPPAGVTIDPVTGLWSYDFSGLSSNELLAAKGRKAVLSSFFDYVNYYENEWHPFVVEDGCNKGRDENQNPPKLYIAINSVKLRKPEGGAAGMQKLFTSMRMIMGAMCMATAGQPGFLGYDIVRQTGQCPAMVRFAVDAEMLDDMSDFWLDQLTAWRDYRDHEKFHALFEDIVMKACQACGMVMTEGPYEHVYAVLDRHLPRPVSGSNYAKILNDPKRINGTPEEKELLEKKVKGYAVDTGEIHNVQMFFDVTPGQEEIFEKYINQVYTNLTNTGHCLGYLVARCIGFNPGGGGNYDVKSMYWEMMDGSGVSQLEQTATIQETFPMQPKYLIRSDWSSAEAVKMYLSQVHTDRRNLFPFSLGVLDRSYTRPIVRVSVPHKADFRWLEYANDTMTPKYDVPGPLVPAQFDGHTLDYVANLPFAPDMCQNKWFYFFGEKTDPCSGHKLRNSKGQTWPVDSAFPDPLPGTQPNPCPGCDCN